ncbi:MAG: nitroreductase family deazaflavin-dependent oxidoreductase [Anaerolineales bacterium]|nr:nitroreductase family deazaflavin-dependent oxidoreductase [Anaerolineales bacterium]
MAEYQIGTLSVSDENLRMIFKSFNRFMLLLWRLGLGAWGNGTSFGGSLMVLKNTGRKTGLIRQTPVNYTIIDGDIYCTAGFGKGSDWFLNIIANPEVEVWLPDSRWAGVAQDVTNMENSHIIFRQVLIASGFAGPLFGANPKQLSDLDLINLLESYRLIRIRPANALTGPGGPGDLAWVWPAATVVLLGLLLLRRKK